MGHLIPLAEFANHLLSSYHFSVTLFLPSSAPPTAAQTSYLSTLPAAVSYTFLPPVDPTLLPPGAVAEVRISCVNLQSLPSLRDYLVSLTRQTRVVALVADLFGTAYFDVAKELGIPPYLYFTSTAMCLSLLLHLPRLNETVSSEYRDMTEPVVLPGCVPLHGKDFLDPVQDRKGEAYKVFLDHVEKYYIAEGIFVNTCMGIESGALNGLLNEYPGLPPIYPVGPIIKSGLGGKGDESGCLAWLDQQPSGSVIFVSFGSGGTLSLEQTIELANGLEKCGQRFIWVVRSPKHSPTDSVPLDFLPKGFVDKVSGRGLLVPNWAPQIDILGHNSTGGFLSHCGWNSILESITNGIPIIGWPLFAEQKMNIVMLKEGLKMALRPKVNESGLIEANEIANVVKELMEGEEGDKARRQVKELSHLAEKARAQMEIPQSLLSKLL